MQVLATLRDGEQLDTEPIGDPLPLPSHFNNARESEISSLFGEAFKKDLFSLETGQWTGPVTSPFGLHLVKIDKLIDSRIPGLDENRDAVKLDWLSDRRRAARQTLFDKFQSKYTVIVEPREEAEH